MSIERVPRKGPLRGHKVRYREAGRQKSKFIPGAKSHAERFEDENKRRLIFGEGDWFKRGTSSFEEFAADWLDRKGPQLSPRTLDDYGTLMDRHLSPAFGNKALRSISVAMIEDWLTDKQRKGTGARQLQMALGVLSQILDSAHARGELNGNPAKLVKGPKQAQKKLVVPLPPEDVEKIRGWLLKNRTLRDATLVSVLAYAGLRPGEALALEWSDIDGSHLNVSRALSQGGVGPTKTHKARRVQLLPSLREDLLSFRMAEGRPDGLIFTGERKPIWTQSMFANWRRLDWNEALTGCKLAHRTPYALRHSFASLLIAEGRNYVEVARQLGHSPTMTLSTYSHVFDAFEPGQRVAAEERIRAAREGRKAAQA